MRWVIEYMPEGSDMWQHVYRAALSSNIALVGILVNCFRLAVEKNCYALRVSESCGVKYV